MMTSHLIFDKFPFFLARIIVKPVFFQPVWENDCCAAILEFHKNKWIRLQASDIKEVAEHLEKYS